MKTTTSSQEKNSDGRRQSLAQIASCIGLVTKSSGRRVSSSYVSLCGAFAHPTPRQLTMDSKPMPCHRFAPRDSSRANITDTFQCLPTSN